MSQAIESELLNLVFGDVAGATAEERAQVSTRRFVRGLDMLTFEHSSRAKGRRLTASEALDAYGFDKLAEVATEGSALICESIEAAGRTLRERREQLGLEIRHIASEVQLAPEIVEALEESRRRPVREYERVARALGLDERLLSFRSEPDANRSVAVRLRDLRDQSPALTGPVVLALSEAAWVAMTQIRLEAALGLPGETNTFEKEPMYARGGRPAYVMGYELADLCRTKLGLRDDPIPSMRNLLERDLHIPVIQTELGQRIAGATIECGGRRAIVVNLSGRNRSAFVRRSTVAHELCHLLFDPRQRLKDLRVDEYTDLERRADQITDPVEQRANAFAVQLLAPQAVALEQYRSAEGDPLAHVLDYFGISFTAGRYQIWNGSQRAIPLESISTDVYRPEDDWEAREAYTTTYHPIRALADHPSRAGRFSAVVIRAAQKHIISWDTAAEWLFSSEAEIQRLASTLGELYPDLFA